ncbi:MAG: DUF559 domain-containing protein [Solirubrobacterales bacterium]|nr:DUF559 domain-containing protein [Solirubrobacterales bacterium]
MDAIESAIAVLAGRQCWYITRKQLLAIGLSTAAIEHRIAIGRLIRVHAGVYAVGHINATPVARAAAAVLACGPGALLSHGSGGTLWGYNKYWDMPFEVTVTTSHRRRPGITVHRSRTLTEADIDCQLDVPVTSPARTLLDITPRLTDKRLRRAINDSRHARYLHLDDLADVLRRNPAHHGTKRLLPFVQQPRGITRSDLEDRFVALARRYGLPTPETNVPLHGYVVDVLFRAERVIVEIDTWDSHGLRTSFGSDRKRDAEMLAFGYVTIRTTDERLEEDPEHEVRLILKVLAERRQAA